MVELSKSLEEISFFLQSRSLTQQKDYDKFNNINLKLKLKM